mmetsp:Transcript_95688/g.169101  ORF Transcript_95688/g.169101 Transcript_95688/m.169101 type:complete len:497 (-) Transcript_95688:213-1703(-)
MVFVLQFISDAISHAPHQIGLLGLRADLRLFCAEAVSFVPPMFYAFIPLWILLTAVLLLSPLTVVLPQWWAGKLSWPSAKDIPDEWIIHGKRYNLKPFYRSHPGGVFPLRAARGSDCTGLFESYHVFIDREVLMKMLKPFEIKNAAPAEKPKVVYSDPFYEDLKKMVREHFKGKSRSARKMTWSHLGLCFLLWSAMWACVFFVVRRDVMWLTPFIGFLSWMMTGTFMHDGSHGAAVSKPWGNRLLSNLAWPFGVNVVSWQIQHVMSHHIYTNEEEDVDLYHFEPFLDYSKGMGKINWFLYALFMMVSMATTILHLAVIVPYHLCFGIVDDVKGNRMYDRVKAITAHRAELKWEMLVELALMVTTSALVIAYKGFWRAAAIFFSIETAGGYFFFFFTQGNHYQAACFPEPQEKEQLSFAKRQVGSSVDYAVDSVFWSFVSGGLNTQALHHCIPSVSQAHYRALYPKFRQVCKEHNVDLKVAPSFAKFLWGYIEHSNS